MRIHAGADPHSTALTVPVPLNLEVCHNAVLFGSGSTSLPTLRYRNITWNFLALLVTYGSIYIVFQVPAIGKNNSLSTGICQNKQSLCHL